MFRPNNNLPTFYNLGLRNHKNLSYGNQGNNQNVHPGFQNQGASNLNYQGQKIQPTLGESIIVFVNDSRKMMDFQDSRMSKMEAHMKQTSLI